MKLDGPTSQTYDEDKIKNKADIAKWAVSMLTDPLMAVVEVAGEI